MKLKALAIDIATGSLMAGAGILLRWSFDPLLGNKYPFAPGYLVVAIGVWYFGWRSAVINVAVFYAFASYLFVEPRGSWGLGSSSEVFGLALNVVSTTILIALGQTAVTNTKRLRTANAALDSANRELAENAKRKDEFLATLSHELRNPLAPIVMATNLLESANIPDKTSAAAVQILSRQTRQMSGLLDDLFDLSRIAKDRFELKKMDVDLKECVEDALQTQRELADRKGQTLEVDLPARPVIARVDPLRFTQVIANLVSNAVRHSPDGALIQIHLTAAENEVAVTVKDNGPGIDAARLPHLFDPFHAGHSLHKTAGLRIGLALSKRLTELHGGSIVAASEGADMGSKFTVTLSTQTG